MTFEQFKAFAATKIVELEGGYVNSKHDLGGETNFGISKKYNPDVNVKNLSRSEAIAFYMNHPYYMSGAETIESIGLRFIYVDVRVCGQRAVVSTLQNILNSFAPLDDSLVADGLWGRKTTQAVNRLSKGLRVPVLQALLALADGIGSTQAIMTIEAQRRAGQPEYDYTKGFTRRAKERAEIAVLLEKGAESKHSEQT